MTKKIKKIENKSNCQKSNECELLKASLEYKIRYDTLKSQLSQFIAKEEKFVTSEGMDYILLKIGQIINKN